MKKKAYYTNTGVIVELLFHSAAEYYEFVKSEYGYTHSEYITGWAEFIGGLNTIANCKCGKALQSAFNHSFESGMWSCSCLHQHHVYDQHKSSVENNRDVKYTTEFYLSPKINHYNKAFVLVAIQKEIGDYFKIKIDKLQ